jgi:hypothetical protein
MSSSQATAIQKVRNTVFRMPGPYVALRLWRRGLNDYFSWLTIAFRSYKQVRIAITLAATLALPACPPLQSPFPVRWTNYPHIAQTTTQLPWLVLKCTLADNSVVPPGLDQTIAAFFTIGGSGTGNLTDYFSDISYGAISFLGSKVMGWYPAGFVGNEPGIGGGPNRYKRVELCANNIPDADFQDVDLTYYYGIVIVTNHQNDLGACYNGQGQLVIKGRAYNLACVVDDNVDLTVTETGHEFGHSLGLPHAFDNTQSFCGSGTPGEYCDHWDIMGDQLGHAFPWVNYPGPGTGTAGPGMGAPELLELNYIPRSRQATYTFDSGNQQFMLNALSHPVGFQPLVLKLIGSNSNDYWTVEYRQKDGWDQGQPNNAILIHEYKVGANPFSFLQEGGGTGNSSGGWTVGQHWIDPSAQVEVWIDSFNTQNGTAALTVSGPSFVHP